MNCLRLETVKIIEESIMKDIRNPFRLQNKLMTP